MTSWAAHIGRRSRSYNITSSDVAALAAARPPRANRRAAHGHPPISLRRQPRPTAQPAARALQPAVVRRRTRLRDGRRRRHHPADRERPVDHRMAADQRRHPAADATPTGCAPSTLYQATPQYREVAGPAGMTLSGFKFIFFWEWVHRLLGRILGLVFFVGVAWFAVKRAIPKGFGWRLAALFVLGGLQGAVGWFMVMSGLEGPHRGQPLPPVGAPAVRLVPVFGADLDRARPARHRQGPTTVAADRLGRPRARHPVHPAAARRLGRGFPRRLCLEHLAGDERPFRSPRASTGRTAPSSR